MGSNKINLGTPRACNRNYPRSCPLDYLQQTASILHLLHCSSRMSIIRTHTRNFVISLHQKYYSSIVCSSSSSSWTLARCSFSSSWCFSLVSSPILPLVAWSFFNRAEDVQALPVRTYLSHHFQLLAKNRSTIIARVLPTVNADLNSCRS